MSEPVLYRVYVSGPMSGRPDYNFPLFNRVAKEICIDQRPMPTTPPPKGCEYLVTSINPAANFEGRQDLAREVYLELALRQVDEADAIVLLPDWFESEGARLEAWRGLVMEVDFYVYHDKGEFDYQIVPVSADTVRAVMRAFNEAPEVAPAAGERIEDEAARLVRGGERQKNYGHPRGDFDTIARYWTNHLGFAVDAKDVAIMMLLLKVARLKSNPDHHDSRVDGIGYLICLDRLDEPQEAA